MQPTSCYALYGKASHTTDVVINCHSAFAPYGNYLKQDKICVSDVLAENGYDTAAYIEKWHLDPGQLPYVEDLGDGA